MSSWLRVVTWPTLPAVRCIDVCAAILGLRAEWELGIGRNHHVSHTHLFLITAIGLWTRLVPPAFVALHVFLAFI